MAIKRIDSTVGLRVEHYLCATTDAASTYPTIAECDIGSTLTTINETTHVTVKKYIFDGTNWNEIV